MLAATAMARPAAIAARTPSRRSARVSRAEATAEAVRRLSGRATALAARLDMLAGDLEECLAVYAETDDSVFQALELRMAGVLS